MKDEDFKQTDMIKAYTEMIKIYDTYTYIIIAVMSSIIGFAFIVTI